MMPISDSCMLLTSALSVLLLLLMSKRFCLVVSRSKKMLHVFLPHLGPRVCGLPEKMAKAGSRPCPLHCLVQPPGCAAGAASCRRRRPCDQKPKPCAEASGSGPSALMHHESLLAHLQSSQAKAGPTRHCHESPSHRPLHALVQSLQCRSDKKHTTKASQRAAGALSRALSLAGPACLAKRF